MKRLSTMILVWVQFSCGQSDTGSKEIGSVATSKEVTSGVKGDISSQEQKAVLEDSHEKESNEGHEGFTSSLVNAFADLPACSAKIRGSLAYVKNVSQFYVCSDSWTLVDLKDKESEPKEPVPLISKNRILKPISTNFCTEFASIERCYFLGGQTVTFSDGSLYMSGTWSFDAVMYAGGDFDSDVDFSQQSVFLNPTDTGGYILLHDKVARGSGYRLMFLVYTRSSNKFSLVYDSNNNFAPDANDTVLVQNLE